MSEPKVINMKNHPVYVSGDFTWQMYSDLVDRMSAAIAEAITGRPRDPYTGSNLQREARIAEQMRERDESLALRMSRHEKSPRAQSHPHEGRSERALPRSNER